jgi:hypothetical protein
MKSGGLVKETLKIRDSLKNWRPKKFRIPHLGTPMSKDQNGTHHTMKKNELRKWRENYTTYTGSCLAEGVRLNVHYEEKDYVKDLGARWCPEPAPTHYSHGKGGYWWMPVKQLPRQPDSNTPSVVNTFEVGQSDTGGTTTGITVLQWLNDNKMLSGDWHGDLDKDACGKASIGETPKEYYLCTMDASMKFEFYDDLQIVRVATREPQGPVNLVKTRESSTWHVADDARALWDSLVDAGAERTEVAV